MSVHARKGATFPLSRLSKGLSHLAVALLSHGVATGLALGFRLAGITESSVVLLYLLSVVIVSVMTDRVFGIAASVVAVVLFNFLFTEPRFTFVVSDPQYLVTFPVLLTVAVISSELMARIRRQAHEAERRELLTKELYESSRSLLGARGQEAVVRAAVDHLAGLTGRAVLCVIDDGSATLRTFATDESDDHERLVTPVRQMLERADTGPAVVVEAGKKSFLLAPVGAQGSIRAVIAVGTERENLPVEANESIRAVAVQLALALDREEMSRREQNARVEIERERLRSNLLQSISHDLRSPLAAIVGSATTLVSEETLVAETRHELARSIRDDARWLTGLVENLLSLTRAEERAVRFRGSVEVLDDVLASALNRVERVHEAHQVNVDVGEPPVLVRIDGGLIEQLVVNLLENVIQHTPSGTSVRLAIDRDGDEAVLIVEDDGPGLSETALCHAFERFYTERLIPDSRRGMGLGLAICKSIAEAHAGTISVSNLLDGGARFEVRLPIEPTDVSSDRLVAGS